MTEGDAFAEIAVEVVQEVRRSIKLHGGLASPWEAYAVILEELDEFWESVKQDDPSREELVQTAAMAIKAIRMLDERSDHR